MCTPNIKKKFKLILKNLLKSQFYKKINKNTGEYRKNNVYDLLS